MLVRLLQLKVAIVTYFQRRHNHPRRLGLQDWIVANEVCSLLDAVSEVTVRIRGCRETSKGAGTRPIENRIES